MKVLLSALALLGFASADFADMEKCIAEKCPTQYEKCLDKTGCR